MSRESRRYGPVLIFSLILAMLIWAEVFHRLGAR